ncbi:Cyclin G [Eumeta japonica]|uniref:Cyclin G n=1 Tax=Eumeta variegata TaxID=151549 RepID=A0A4C1XRJ7_EUMVA|nr:Cyclin G [Eumeta japonica]
MVMVRPLRAAVVDDPNSGLWVAVSVSSAACTARDAARMSHVITDKLAGAGVRGALTPLQWARLFAAFVRRAARSLLLPDRLALCPDGELANLVEIAACDADCANARASEIALVLLCHKLQCQFNEWGRAAARGGPPLPEDACWLFDLIAQLQHACQMSEASLSAVHALVSRVLARYEARSAATHRQRLVWRLSERTLKVGDCAANTREHESPLGILYSVEIAEVLRPTDRLTSLLPTIEEQHMAGDGSPQRHRQRYSTLHDESDAGSHRKARVTRRTGRAAPCCPSTATADRAASRARAPNPIPTQPTATFPLPDRVLTPPVHSIKIDPRTSGARTRRRADGASTGGCFCRVLYRKAPSLELRRGRPKALLTFTRGRADRRRTCSEQQNGGFLKARDVTPWRPFRGSPPPVTVECIS